MQQKPKSDTSDAQKSEALSNSTARESLQDGTSPASMFKEFCYAPLPRDKPVIRLLRILPSKDNNAILQCGLFEYALDSDESTHLYEALSYVWGSPDDDKIDIRLDDSGFQVTQNLHAALLHLRNGIFERILWVDAMCINQDDVDEKEDQIQLMATIFGNAKMVLIWLGPEADGSGTALRDIRDAAVTNMTDSHSAKATSHYQNILALLDRPWFRRIWVLQEVALAKNILVICGNAELNGYAFFQGLGGLSLERRYGVSLQALVGSFAYLIAYRSRYEDSPSNSPSLPELVDMYHLHMATKDHDKIYALLGMTKDGTVKAHFRPDYKTPWKDLLRKLVTYCLGSHMSVVTWDDRQVAFTESQGVVIGKIVSVTALPGYYDRQNVEISFCKSPVAVHFERAWTAEWSLQATAQPLQRDDIVCLLLGNPRPVILRARGDYFQILVIAVTPQHYASRLDSPWEHYQPMAFSHGIERYNFLLVWDWSAPTIALSGVISSTEATDSSGDQICSLVSSFSAANAKQAGRLYDVAKILVAAGAGHEASSRLHIMSKYQKSLGSEHHLMLSRQDLLALTLKLEKKWDDAIINYRGAITSRTWAQGLKHPDTLKSTAGLASVYVARSGMQGWDLRMQTRLIDRLQAGTEIMERDVMRLIASTHEEDLLSFLVKATYDEGHVPITERIVWFAAQQVPQKWNMIQTLLHRRHDLVPNDRTVAWLVRVCDDKTIQELSMRYDDHIQVTEAVVKAAALNERYGRASLRLMLQQWKGRYSVSGEILLQLLQLLGEDVIKLVSSQDRSSVTVTREVVAFIAAHFSEKAMQAMQHFLGGNIPTSEEVLFAANTNIRHGPAIMATLLKGQGAVAHLTEDVMEAIAARPQNGTAMLSVVSKCSGSDIRLTIDMMEQVASNKDSEMTNMIASDDIIHNSSRTIEIVVKKAAMNKSSGHVAFLRLLRLLVLTENISLYLTQDVLEAGAGNTRYGSDICRSIKISGGPRMNVAIMKSAIGNRDHGREILDMLKDKWENDVEITEEMMILAAENKGTGYDIMELLLKSAGHQVLVTGPVFEAAANNEIHSKRMTQLLFQLFPFKTNALDHLLTEDVLIQMLRTTDEKSRPHLYEWLQSHAIISDRMIDAALQNAESRLLLDFFFRQGLEFDLQITDKALAQIIRSFGSDDDLMKDVLKRPGRFIRISNHVIDAVESLQSDDWRYWNIREEKSVLQSFLDRLHVTAIFTDEAMHRILRFYTAKCIVPLLDRLGKDMPITDSVIEAAAGNFQYGSELMQAITAKLEDDYPAPVSVIKATRHYSTGTLFFLLYSSWDWAFPLTDDLLKIATGCDGRVWELMRERWDEDIPISEGVMRTVVRRCTPDALRWFFHEFAKNARITEGVMKLAVLRDDGILQIIHHYKGQNVVITDDVFDTVWAFRSEGCAMQVVHTLLDLWRDNVAVTPNLMLGFWKMDTYSQGVLRDMIGAGGVQLSGELIVGLTFAAGEEAASRVLDSQNENYQVTRGVIRALLVGPKELRNTLLWLFLSRLKDKTSLTEEVLVDIARAFDEELMTLLLEHWNSAPVTEKTLQAALQNQIDGSSVLKVLLDRPLYRSSITERVMMTAVAMTSWNEGWDDGRASLQLLIEQGGFNYITNDVLRTALKNKKGEAMTRLLLDHLPDSAVISAELMETAIQRPDGGKVLSIIFSKWGNCIRLTWDMMIQVVRWQDASTMQLITDQFQFNKARITGQLVESAAENVNHGRSALNILLKHSKMGVLITDDAVVQMARHFDKQVLRLALRAYSIGTECLETAVDAASENEEHCEALIRLLLERSGVLDQPKAGVRLTKWIVIRITQSASKSLTRLALDHFDGNLDLNELIEAASHNENHGEAVFEMLLERTKDILSFDEEVLVSGARAFGPDAIRKLWERKARDVEVTTPILEAAARNKKYGERLIRLLLKLKPHGAEYTDSVFRAAAANPQGAGIIMLLIRHQNTDHWVSPGVLEAAAGNPQNRVLELALYHRGNDVEVTDEALIQAAGQEKPDEGSYVDGEDRFLALLSRRKPDVPLSEEVILAAVRSGIYAPRSRFQQIVDQYGEDVLNKEHILLEAIRCGPAHTVLDVLAGLEPEKITITEEMVKALLTYGEWREHLLRDVIRRWGKRVPITPEVMEIAAEIDDERRTIAYLENLPWLELNLDIV